MLAAPKMFGYFILLAGALSVAPRQFREQPALTTTRVRLRDGPSMADSVLRILPSHTGIVLLAPDSSVAGFFRVRTSNGIEAWIHGHYLVPRSSTNPGMGAAVLATSGYGVCGGKHYYRWAAKKDHAQVSAELTPVTVAGLLAWPAFDLGRDVGSWCADRADRELESFELTGWVRRVRKHEADGDWHLELTGVKTAALSRCIIAEIPDESYGAEYGIARGALDQLLSGSTIDARSGIVLPPVRVRLAGPAFYDGWHSTSRDHGGCNSTPGAIWELHPVFEVSAP